MAVAEGQRGKAGCAQHHRAHCGDVFSPHVPLPGGSNGSSECPALPCTLSRVASPAAHVGLCVKPLPTAGLLSPLPGNARLFRAHVGSLLSAAADGLYLAGFNELRVADAGLGITILACMRISMLGMVCSGVCACVHTHWGVRISMRVVVLVPSFT